MRTFLLAVAFIPAVAGSARADIFTFTDSAAFFAAIGGGTLTTEGYEGPAVNTLIPGGTMLNGVTYNFSAPTLGGSQGQGRIDNFYAGFGNQSLAIFRTTTSTELAFPDPPEPSDQSFFYPGESVTLTFPNAVNAVGIFFNAVPENTQAGDFFIQTPLGTATNGLNPVTGTGSLFPTLYFVGLISTSGSFTTATIGGIDTGVNGGFNLDNLTFGSNVSVTGIPEPGTLAVLGGLLLATGAACRRRREPTAAA
jgi:hypothetical protein